MEALEGRQLLSLIVDIRMPDGSKVAEASYVGQKIQMNVWATVTGNDSTVANDGLVDVLGSFVSSGNGPAGNLSAQPVAPFTATGAQAGRVQDLNGDGNLDVGTNDMTVNGGNDVFYANGGTLQAGTKIGNSRTYLIAALTYTVTGVNPGSTTVDFQRFELIGANWLEDGAQKTIASPGAVYEAGAPLTIINYGTPRIALSAKGVLTVTGTSAADTIGISAGKTQLTASVHGVSRTVLKSAVKAIKIYGLGGNDSISIGKGVIGATIDGGDGNDTIKGGFGDDVLIGGLGSDVIYGSAGNDTIYSRDGKRDTIDGGTGVNSAQIDVKWDTKTRIQRLLK